MIAVAILSVLIICFKYACKRQPRNQSQVSDLEDPYKYTNRTIAYPQSHQGIYTIFDSSANNNDLPTYTQVINGRREQRSGDERLESEGRAEPTQSFQLRTINVQQRETDEKEQDEQESIFM